MMSREVPGKTIDNSHPGPSDLEASVESETDAQLGNRSFWESPGSELREGSNNSFSLNAFEISEETDPSLPVKGLGDGLLPSNNEQGDSEDRAAAKKFFSRFSAHKKVFLYSCGILFFCALAGIAIVFAFRSSEQKNTISIITSLRRPIPIPQYQDKLDFFILVNAESQKSILSLGIEFEFQSTGAYQRFRDENVLFRDVVYRFLETGRPGKNTQKAWDQIIQHDLQTHLKTALPHAYPVKMRIDRFEKL